MEYKEETELLMARKVKGEGEEERVAGVEHDEFDRADMELDKTDEDAVRTGFLGVPLLAEAEVGGVALCRSFASSPESSLFDCKASAAALSNRFVVPVAFVSPDLAEQTSTNR